MTNEQRADLAYCRRQLTELEFALMDCAEGIDGAEILASMIGGTIEAAVNRLISGVEGTPALERVGLGRAF